MNQLHEFIFIASGITVIFTIVIIGLIVSNRKQKVTLVKDYIRILEQKSKFYHDELDDFDKNKKVFIDEKSKLESQIKFKDDLIHGYKQDLKKIVGLEDDKEKMQYAIDALEKYIRELKEANEAWKMKYNRVRYEKAESFKKNIVDLKNEIRKLTIGNNSLLCTIGELSEKIKEFEKRNKNITDFYKKEEKALEKLVDECAMYIMNHCK